jgi:hypothetical protein
MKRSKITAVVFLMSMFLVAQVMVGQGNSPQPNATSGNNNSTPAGPTKATQQKQQRQERQQRGRNQQSSQSQPMQPQFQQQQIARVEPQQQFQRVEPQPEIPIAQQPQLQQQEQRKQRQPRRVHRSNPVPASVMSYSTALEHCQRDRHPHVWWTQHYAVIVYSVGGYYYFDAGYWYPALGYSPNYESYDYDGPIYTYGNLLPDQVILNVQRALKDLGYYEGALSGSLSAATRYAISAYQEDNGLTVNGVVDAPLVYSLGLQ